MQVLPDDESNVNAEAPKPNQENGENFKPAVVVVQHAKKQKPAVKSTNLSHILMLDPNKSLLPQNFFVASHYVIDKPHLHRKYELNILQRIFVVIERPDSCLLAYILSIVFMVLILLGVILYVLGNDPAFMVQSDHCTHEEAICYHQDLCPYHVVCPLHEVHWMEEIEAIILYCFTIEYGIRALLCPIMPSRFLGLLNEDEEFEDHMQGKTVEEDEEMPIWKKVPLYLIQYKNLIDVATIVPFYALTGGGSFNFIRALRLVRVLHIFKLSKENEILHLLERTIKLSLPALGLVSFVGALLMILLGSILFFAEQGTFTVTAEYPHGEFMRWNLMHDQLEKSPFRSLQISLYWMIQTCTNTGYGDLYPTSQMGRIVASITMCVGVVICGLPIGVLGSNFSHEYDLYHSKFREHVGLDSGDDDSIGTAGQKLLEHYSSHGILPGSDHGHNKEQLNNDSTHSRGDGLSPDSNISSGGTDAEQLRSLVKSYQQLQLSYARTMADLTQKVDEISRKQVAVNEAIAAAMSRLGIADATAPSARP